MKKKIIVTAVAAAMGTLTVSSSQAGVKFQDGDKYVKLGGRIQLQYHSIDKDAGDTSDSVSFRRLRPYIEGSTHKDWKGKFQWDMGVASDTNEFAINDAYMQYKGYKNVKITIGNAYTQFSREDMNSSKYLNSVERTFVGDHNYGSPERGAGLHVSGHNDSKMLVWGVDLAAHDIDPDANKLDFDTPVNKNTDFNQGWLVNGRVDYYPMGHFKMSQGDFSGQQRLAVGLAAFTWNNDGDNHANLAAASIDSVTGIELSGAYRGNGFSVDAEYNTFSADNVDSTFTGGLYKNGSTTLDTYAIKAGYMILPAKFEVIADYQGLDADNYADTWTRSEVGVNYYVAKHDIKFQVTYRMNSNVKGVNNADEDELFAQAQYVF